MLRRLSSLLILMVLCSPAWSATQLKKTVCPSGCDYTSLESAMNGNEQNLVTADKYFDVEISGTWSSADTTAVTIHNYTTDATRYINIYTTGSARHDGTAWKSGTYVRQVSGTSINVAANYVTLKDFIINCDNSTNYGILETNARTSNLYQNLIIHNSTSATATINLNVSSSIIIENLIMFDVKRGVYSASDNPNIIVYNSTILGSNTPTYGILRVKAINCYVGGFGTGDYYSISAGSDYLVSSDATGDDVAANSAINKNSYSSYFTNISAGSEDYHLKNDSNTLWGLSGTDLSATFTTDIDGQTRSVPWDIGADEYVSTASGNPPAGVTTFRIKEFRGTIQ